MAVLDLRPEKGSVLDRLLRIGLVYDHEETTDDGKTYQYWVDYNISLQAKFLHPDDAEVQFTDLDTRISKVVSKEELETISSVITWRSKYGLPGAPVSDDSGASDDLDLT